MKYVMEDEVGEANEFGNYSGMIGYLQRDEADLAIQFARSDQLKYEPVKLGPPAGPADMVFISKRIESTNSSLQVTDVVNRMDSLAFYWFFFTSYFVLFFLTMAVESSGSVAFVKKVAFNAMQMLALILDQEHNSPEKSAAILWLFYVVGCFVAVFGFFQSLLSSDLIANYPAHQINSLSDQMSPAFNHVQPHVVKNLYVYSILKMAKSGSLESKLLRRLDGGVGLLGMQTKTSC